MDSLLEQHTENILFLNHLKYPNAVNCNIYSPDGERDHV